MNRPAVRTLTIGVLAMQGAFQRHGQVITVLGHRSIEVRQGSELDAVEGLIIPGGESTTIGKLLVKNNLIEPLRERILSGMPVFGTCAGMILLSKNAGIDQPLLATMDITVERNAYGRQKESFESAFTVQVIDGEPFTGIFIRAPRILSTGPGVEILARFEDSPVLVKEGNMLAASFHPELTGDMRIHEFFCGMIRGN